MRDTTLNQSMCRNLAAVSLATFVFFTAEACLLASTEKKPQLPASSIHQVVKNVAWNELRAAEHPKHYYRYLERTASADGTRTTDVISTSHGNVDRLIEVNQHQPDQQQIQKNQQMLAKLPNNIQLQQSRFKNQQSNKQRRDNVIKDIPKAFIYTYAGRNPQGQIMLKFRPAPNFHPSSNQSLILEGMAGELWVDPKTQRMVKIDGKLIRNVKIGWGFLAKLNAGGTFLMEQSQGPDGTWHQKLLAVHFDGTKLIFAHIHIRVKEFRCCFQQVPDNLSIAAAIHMLQSKIQLPKGWKSHLNAIQKSAPSN